MTFIDTKNYELTINYEFKIIGKQQNNNYDVDVAYKIQFIYKHKIFS